MPQWAVYCQVREQGKSMENNRNEPLVSVIMPVYNAERFVAAAIESVLAQTMADLKLWVIDDGSTDNSLPICMEYAARDKRVHILRNSSNSGVAKTRNRGISQATGAYIAFLDSDDVWHPEKLCMQLELLKSTGSDIAYCSYAIIDHSGEKCRADYLVPECVTRRKLLKENCMQCSAMLIKAGVLQKIHFTTEFYHEDYVLGLDMLGAGYTAVGCRQVLLDWRYLQNSRSFDKRKSALNRWRIYRDYLHLPFGVAIYYFSGYALAGLRKYLRR